MRPAVDSAVCKRGGIAVMPRRHFRVTAMARTLAGICTETPCPPTASRISKSTRLTSTSPIDVIRPARCRCSVDGSSSVVAPRRSWKGLGSLRGSSSSNFLRWTMCKPGIGPRNIRRSSAAGMRARIRRSCSSKASLPEVDSHSPDCTRASPMNTSISIDDKYTAASGLAYIRDGLNKAETRAPAARSSWRCPAMDDADQRSANFHLRLRPFLPVF